MNRTIARIGGGIACWMLCSALALAGPWDTRAAELISEGNKAYAAGRFEDALKAYQDARVAAPESCEATMNVGLAQARLGKHEEAIEAFDRALQLNPQDPKVRAEILYNRSRSQLDLAGKNLEESKDREKALEQGLKALRSENEALAALPKFDNAQYNRSQVQHFLGQLAQAQQDKKGGGGKGKDDNKKKDDKKDKDQKQDQQQSKDNKDDKEKQDPKDQQQQGQQGQDQQQKEQQQQQQDKEQQQSKSQDQQEQQDKKDQQEQDQQQATSGDKKEDKEKQAQPKEEEKKEQQPAQPQEQQEQQPQAGDDKEQKEMAAAQPQQAEQSQREEQKEMTPEDARRLLNLLGDQKNLKFVKGKADNRRNAKDW